MSRESEPSKNVHETHGYHQYATEPAEVRCQHFLETGQPEFVANFVLNELGYLPDSEKRKMVAAAARNRANEANSLYSNRYSRAKEKQAKTLERSRKEGKALEKQLKNIYSFARFKG